jgi:hypothetical protein
MPSLDIFNNDAFGVQSLTKAINDLPHQPTRIGELKLFTESGITTTALSIERRGQSLSLVPAAQRGNARGLVNPRDKRRMIPFNTVHLPQSDAVIADEVQNVRAFGSETEVESVQTLVNKRLEKMRRNIDVTLEYHRIGAIKGQVLDADGSTVLLDLFTQFDLTKTTHDMVLDNDATKVILSIMAAKRKMEDKLGGLMYSGLRAFCSAEFFDALVAHPAVEKAYLNWAQAGGQFISQDHRSGFTWGGVTWEEYRGQVNGTRFIEANKAHLVPEGVPDLFVTNFAPADYMETVNTNGLPYYAKQEAMRMNKGVELEAQSNPISLCTRPDAVVELSI